MLWLRVGCVHGGERRWLQSSGTLTTDMESMRVDFAKRDRGEDWSQREDRTIGALAGELPLPTAGIAIS